MQFMPTMAPPASEAVADVIHIHHFVRQGMRPVASKAWFAAVGMLIACAAIGEARASGPASVPGGPLASGQAYRCQDGSGAVMYSERPCPNGAATVLNARDDRTKAQVKQARKTAEQEADVAKRVDRRAAREARSVSQQPALALTRPVRRHAGQGAIAPVLHPGSVTPMPAASRPHPRPMRALVLDPERRKQRGKDGLQGTPSSAGGPI